MSSPAPTSKARRPAAARVRITSECAYAVQRYAMQRQLILQQNNRVQFWDEVTFDLKCRNMLPNAWHDVYGERTTAHPLGATAIADHELTTTIVEDAPAAK